MQSVVKYFCPDCHAPVTADCEDGRLFCPNCEHSIRIPDESHPCAICKISPQEKGTHWGYLFNVFLAKAYLRQWTGNTLSDSFENRKIARSVLPVCRDCYRKDRRRRFKAALLGGTVSVAFFIFFAYGNYTVQTGWIRELFGLAAIACFLLICTSVSRMPFSYDRRHVPFATDIKERLEKHVGKDHIGNALFSDRYVMEIGSSIGSGKNETCNVTFGDYREIDWENLEEWLDSPG